MSQRIDLNEKAKELIKMAENSGLEQNYFFTTTFARYQVQLKMLEKLRIVIEQDTPLVEKEYIKGRKNIVVHPAITEYNKTVTAANQTVQTLMKIVVTLSEHTLQDGITDLDEL